jgi:transglutaminase-like putative cysteine protease
MFSIDITPAPDGLTEAIDAWDNDVVGAWFSGMHESLEITTRFVVETHWENPFDFIVPGPDAEGLSPSYSEDERAALAPYLVTQGTDPAVRDLADEAARASGSSVVSFPGELARKIHERCEVVYRPTGPPLPAAETLATGRGSCRDLTVLFMEASRCVGVAARFISGYAAHATPGEEHELHAWGGVYVPGGGWRPYDPSRGLAVAQGHVQIAAAARPGGAAPVEGTFRGSGAQSELSTHVSLDVT